jgi:hypothetical protein
MFLTAIWNILTKLESYTDKGYLVDQVPEAQKTITAEQGLKLLRSRGYVIQDAPTAPTAA